MLADVHAPGSARPNDDIKTQLVLLNSLPPFCPGSKMNEARWKGGKRDLLAPCQDLCQRSVSQQTFKVITKRILYRGSYHFIEVCSVQHEENINFGGEPVAAFDASSLVRGEDNAEISSEATILKLLLQ